MKLHLLALLSIGSLAYAAENGTKFSTPLHTAAKSCQYSIIKALLDAGQPVDAQDSQGRTALMQASRNCSRAHILLLLNHGAAIDARDKKKRTALNYAAQSCNFSSMGTLVQQGADVSVMHERNGFGRTPFQDAEKDCLGVTTFLYGAQTRKDLNSLKKNK